ncbi:Gamma-glutamylputrescine oxidoreductase [Pseudoruegeria aquimaris]|uniref:Gamma-glutamylputrescine oxidoreductase n=1 Tax=Pseudoruegeria aquimaris TaxID=393663 RepID=A0A1Y5SK46_9RHOB|nr:FAD-binding oxidoreductase [Pseudoruegeria aquimaris]SLN41463.1 Gamma-glutamylputrescine oxidoreductase [Pseudoruegeria aquimaris]
MPPRRPLANLWQESAAETFRAPALVEDAEADLLIIGGGYSGCAAALAAAQAGAKVALLEARTIGHGGSGRNVGLVNAGLWMPPEEINAALGIAAGEALTATLAQAPDRVFNLIETHGISCEATRAGTLHCAHGPAGLKDLESRHAQLSARGAPVRLLDAAETARRTGSPRFPGALFDPRAGTIQPLAYVRGLARAATAAGAHIYEHSPAVRLTRSAGAWQADTAGGTLRAPRLLLATNAYHAATGGQPAPAHVPVHYFQLATAPLGDRGAAILQGGEGAWDTALVMSSFRRDAAGRLIIGGIGSLEHGAGIAHRDWAARKLAQLFPALAGTPLHHAWHGRIAMTGDHVPRILSLGEGALALFGYSGRGIGPGTVFGEAAAQALVSGDASALPLAPVEHHSEPAAGLRAAWYEAGATLTHLLGARF